MALSPNCLVQGWIRLNPAKKCGLCILPAMHIVILMRITCAFGLDEPTLAVADEYALAE